MNDDRDQDSDGVSTDPASSVDRRKLLASVGGALTTGLAGCNHRDDEPDNTPPANTPDVTLQDVRVVQNVEDSEQTRSGDTLPDPPIVAGEYATVMFDLDITHPESLPETVPVAVTSPGTNFDYTQVLSRSDMQEINAGGDAPAVFDETARNNGPGDPPDVQKMPADIDEINVKILHQHIDGDEVTLVEGVNCDFRVREIRTLRVGFINVKDPGDAQSPELTREEAQSRPGGYTTDIDWGDQDGETIYYDRSVNSSVAYLKHAYPGKVVAYRHKETDPMLGVIRENWANGTGKDASRAKKALNSIRSSNTFPQEGTIYADEGITQQEAQNMMAGSDGAFDIWVMILPRDNAANRQHYFAAHGMTRTLGYHWNFSTAVASLEVRSDSTSDDLHGMITAQEIGHRYSDSLYTGSFAQSLSDQRHSTSALESVGYDFNDGTYNLVNDYEIRDGSFSPGTQHSASNVVTHTSYMTSAQSSTWPDSHIHRYLVDGNYTRGFGGGSSKRQDCFQPPETARPPPVPEAVIDVHANTDGDIVDIDSSDTYVGIPDDVGDDGYDPEMFPDAARPVEITLQGPTGEQLASATVPDRTAGTHHDRVHESIDVSLQFPEQAVILTADRGGVTSTMNPIVHPLRSALRRVPERGFVTEPAHDRERLSGLLAEVDSRMSDDDYSGAHDAMVEFESVLSETVRESYDTYAYQPTRVDLRARAERMLGRLDTLAAADTGGGGGTSAITIHLPDGTTRTVQPVEGAQSVEDYYGYSSGPSDSANTPDGLEVEDATVTFVYQNTQTGDRSLVVINGDATDSSDGGGKAVFTFTGVSGAEWQVQDGPPGSGFGDFDPYETEEGPLGDAESVIWGWDDSKTDGGAIGPLGTAFEVSIVHRSEGTVRDRTEERTGLDEWLFVDGGALDDPLVVETFDGTVGDVTLDISKSG